MQVRDVVLVHVIPRLLKFDDLVALPSDELVETLLDGAKLRPSLAGATSGSNAGEAGSGSIGLIDEDLSACAPNSTLHTIKGLLLPDDFELPETAQPRALDAQDGVEGRAVPPGDDAKSDSGGSLGTGAIAGIAAAAVALQVCKLLRNTSTCQAAMTPQSSWGHSSRRCRRTVPFRT